MAGWKRGKEGNIRCPGAFEDWREAWPVRRRACDGMARGSVLGDRGELTEGMLRSVRGDMFWWGEVELESSRESKDGDVGVDLI